MNKLYDFWAYIKSNIQTITGTWNFTGILKVGGQSVGSSLNTLNSEVATINATLSGLPVPNYLGVFTTTTKNALTPSLGNTCFDSTLHKLCVYTGSAWETITSV